MNNKFPPIQGIRRVLQAESRRVGGHNLWTYNDETNTIWLYTSRPGVWIGMAGQNLKRIQQLLDNEITKHNDLMNQIKIDDRVEKMTLKIVECDY